MVEKRRRGLRQLERIPITVGQLRRFRSTNIHDDEIARPIILVVETYEAITLIKGPERVETHVRYLINGILESGPLDVIERYTEPVDETW